MSEGCKFFGRFYYIIENKNEDIVVFDFFKCVVIVIDMRGRYWFLYIGFLLNVLNLMGICIDVLLYIFVWDYISKIV